LGIFLIYDNAIFYDHVIYGDVYVFYGGDDDGSVYERDDGGDGGDDDGDGDDVYGDVYDV
jgi:hypothetical protein